MQDLLKYSFFHLNVVCSNWRHCFKFVFQISTNSCPNAYFITQQPFVTLRMEWPVPSSPIAKHFCYEMSVNDNYCRYLVPADLTVGQFVYVVRKRIKLSAEKAIFIFVKNILPPTAAMMSAIYEEHKDEDGFLYMTYSGENTFGSFWKCSQTSLPV